MVMFALEAAHAASIDVPMSLVSADGATQTIGTISISETQYGLLCCR